MTGKNLYFQSKLEASEVQPRVWALSSVVDNLLVNAAQAPSPKTKLLELGYILTASIKTLLRLWMQDGEYPEIRQASSALQSSGLVKIIPKACILQTSLRIVGWINQLGNPCLLGVESYGSLNYSSGEGRGFVESEDSGYPEGQVLIQEQ